MTVNHYPTTPGEFPMSLADFPMKELGVSIQMVGALYADKDTIYVLPLPNAVEEQQRQVLAVLHLQDYVDGIHLNEIVTVDLSLDEWLKVLQQTDLVEVEALVRDPETKQLAKAIVRKSERQISQQVSWTVYRRDEFKCRYCGAADVPLTVDHLITWESGGMSVPENLVASCRRCNSARGTLPFAEWLTDPYYKRVKMGLAYEEQFKNAALVATLAKIPVSPRMGKRTR